MRISDWSSDVCSSDLTGLFFSADGSGPSGLRCLCLYRISLLAQLALCIFQRLCRLLGQGGTLCCSRTAVVRSAAEDRKSVVLGKSVSVRVDLGGRRIIKKKITTNTRRQPTNKN